MATNVKNKEFNLLAGHLSHIFLTKVDPFRYDLKVLRKESGVSEVPKSKMFGLVRDILSLPAFVSNYGDWVVAEVDGLDVQFNPMVLLSQVQVQEPRAKGLTLNYTGVQSQECSGSSLAADFRPEDHPHPTLLAELNKAKAKKGGKSKAKSTAKMAEFPLPSNGADKSLD